MIVRVEPRVEQRDQPVRDAFGNIPVPVARPMSPAEEYRAEYVAYRKSLQEAVDLREWERLIQPRPIPPERLAVRVVGTGFLPGPDAEMDFDRIARGGANPLDDVLVSVLSWIDRSLVSTAVALEVAKQPEGKPVQTASAK